MPPHRFRPDRRTVIAGGAGLLVPAAWAVRGATPPPSISPLPCADFLGGIGVNTHLAYAKSQYGDASAIRAALEYIGVTHARDGAINPRRPDVTTYHALAEAGVRFCMFWSSNRDMAQTIAEISAFEAAFPNAVQALEGPNEIKPGFSYAGLSGNPAAQKFMSDMRAAAGSDARLRGKRLVCFTTYAPVEADCDFANAHPYPKFGAQPGPLLKTVRDRFVGQAGAMPGKPMVFTEFGYHTLVGRPARPAAWQGVDPERQAVLILNGLLDNAAAGIARTYIYQLMDGDADKGATPNQEHHFGLFALDGSPKPAAGALRKLRAILSDDGSDRGRPHSLPVRILASPPLSHLVLQAPSGRHFIALWNESPVWDRNAMAPLEAPELPATVALTAPAPLRAFDPIDPRRDRDLGRAGEFIVKVGAHPVLLRIG